MTRPGTSEHAEGGREPVRHPDHGSHGAVDGASGPDAPPRRRRRRAVRPGVEQPSQDERTWEDDDRAWGDRPDPDDDRLRREIPPHWS